MIKWIKKLLHIVRYYDADRNGMWDRIEAAERVIRERTDIHADVHCKSENQIIVVGRYRNKDYIQTFSVHREDFPALIERLREMERYGHVARVDAPPMMRAVVEHEVW